LFLRGQRRDFALVLPSVMQRFLSTLACGFVLVASACSSTSNAEAGRGFEVTVSGEDLAQLGYPFGPNAEANGDPPAFVDGWELSFEHVIVTVDKLRLNAEPDRDEGNPQDVGAVVAQVDGPWAVDLTLGGDRIGKSGSPDERTVAIARFDERDNGEAFDATSRYAFSYDFVTASDDAEQVNLDAEGQALYEQAKASGAAMLFVGTARYRGPEPEEGSVFASMPREVKFNFALSNPSSYINCRNTDLAAVAGEFPRGIQASPDHDVTVQITLHTDHTFWDTLNVEGTPLHFDPIAAAASTEAAAEVGSVSLEELVDWDVTAFATRDGEALPARSLVDDYTAPSGQLRYDANGTSFRKANSFAAYLAYAAASGGHLNADGECEVKNRFEP